MATVKTEEEIAAEGREKNRTIWDEYQGQYVCLQLKRPYMVITAPGHPCLVEDGDQRSPISVSVVAGLLGVKKDPFGGVRITMLMKDPDSNKTSAVRADFSPELIDVVSVTPQESKIITP